MNNILNKENTGVNLPTNPIKNVVAPNSVLKKCVLGKLDNVMHQTPKITPFKRNTVRLEDSTAKLSFRKTHKQTIIAKDREEEIVRTTSCYLGAYMLRCEAQAINLFNYTDFPNEKCLKKCGKPITETWSDSQSGYDALFKQLYCDPCKWEEQLGNQNFPPLVSDYDELTCINDAENIETDDYQFVLDLFAPMPNLESVDILF
uniref:Uncharacterized protein LOC108041313 n=1 Tax=Drosophila rhopaloa TaxID=1041015 RepID=A0A6P4EDU8_DRORH